MQTYAAVLLPCFLLLTLSTLMSRSRQSVVVGACGVFLTGFAALRGYVGTDTFAYHQIFRQGATEDFTLVLRTIEPVFAIFIKFIAAFSDSGFAFVSFVAVVQGALLTRLAMTSRSPAQFLMLYLALFYLNLHFNIIRAGIAVLFLIAAIRVSPGGSQRNLYAYAMGALLSHYSAIIVAFPLLVLRQPGPVRKAIATILIILGCAFAYVFGEFDEVVARYLAYSDILAADAANSISLSFLLGIPLYMLMYVSAVNRSNALGLTALFCVWLAVRWLTSIYSLVGRVEIVINCVLVFSILEMSLIGWRSRLRAVAVCALAAMWMVGSLLGLSREDDILSNLGVESALYLNSPFVPYRFFWEEVQPPS